jgi:hypothetical protein
VIPSDISIDLSHEPEPSNQSDYDEQKEREQIMDDIDKKNEQEDGKAEE